MMADDAYRALGLVPPGARCPVPGPCQTIAELLVPQLERDASAPALAGRFSRLTYGELDGAVNAAAAAMRERGIAAGDRVAMALANHPELVIAFLATQRIGAVWVGMNPALAPAEKRRLLGIAAPALLLCDGDTATQLADTNVAVLEVTPGQSSQWSEALAQHRGALAPQVDFDPFAPAAIAFTSGTTGTPKGVVHSQHNLCVVAEARLQQVPEQNASVDGVALPLTILNVMTISTLTSLRSGGLSVLIDTLHPPELARRIAQERIGSMQMASPTLYDLLNNPSIAHEDLATLTSPGVGGAHVSDGLRDQYEQLFGREAMFGYGLTEAPTAVAAMRIDRPRRPGSSGLPLAHLEIGILDEGGRAVTSGGQGEICVRARDEGKWAGVYTPMLGYWRKPDETAHALRGGWLHTGDFGLIDEAGELHVKDRATDLILRGGANVFPVEIERAILQVPGVAACSVVGLPDDRLGERIAVALELAAGSDGEDVLRSAQTLCAAQLARYKRPEEWHVLDALPRNAMGKVVKSRLLAHLQVGGIDAEGTTP